ncbi:isoaspartyl peptidase/L-asparaginase family protein [Neptunicella sp. SCSIO 80796]|uniref:isoaspartyl peptidase/L-asparaginase family protein n=1 Tax=Neptunicella plasticusilytica TaxID=3117012 RepID=UPI003A4D56C3
MRKIFAVLMFLLSVTAQAADIAIVIHGGAGTIKKANMSEETEQAYRQKLAESVQKGYAVLKQGGNSLDAVVAAIQNMENSPLFNAGKGAVFTWDETHELDASIMEGKTLNAGAVAGVSRIKSPIAAAKAVMEKSVHVMLSGVGAEHFAQQQQLEMVDNRYFDTDRRREALHKVKAKLLNNDHAMQVSQDMTDYKFGTVGAVALDNQGNLAAGTSTGGMTAKRWGRIGDSPIIGAGTYADNASCAVSATGHGEYFIRYHVAADICARVKYQGKSVAEAGDEVISQLLAKAGGDGGVIILDSKGNIAMPFNTAGMYRASIDTQGKVTVKIYSDEVE